MRGLAAQCVIVMLAIGAAMKYLAPVLVRDENDIYAMMIIYLGLLLLVVARGVRAQLNWKALFGRSPSIADLPVLAVIVPLALITAGALTVVFVPLSYVEPEAIEQLILRDTAMFDLHSAWDVIRLTLAVVIVAPVVEELIFRGFFFTRIAHKWGTPVGVLGSSALFAFMHPEWLGHFVIGVSLSLVYLRTRSLSTAMLTHGLYNLLTLFPIIYAFARHEPPDTNTTLAEFRDGLSGGLMALLSGLGLLWFYLHLYWPDRMAARVMEQTAPYEAC